MLENCPIVTITISHSAATSSRSSVLSDLFTFRVAEVLALFDATNTQVGGPQEFRAGMQLDAGRYQLGTRREALEIGIMKASEEALGAWPRSASS